MRDFMKSPRQAGVKRYKELCALTWLANEDFLAAAASHVTEFKRKQVKFSGIIPDLLKRLIQDLKAAARSGVIAAEESRVEERLTDLPLYLIDPLSRRPHHGPWGSACALTLPRMILFVGETSFEAAIHEALHILAGKRFALVDGELQCIGNGLAVEFLGPDKNILRYNWLNEAETQALCLKITGR